MITATTSLPGIEQVRKNRGWFLFLGILLIVVGTIAIGETFLLPVFSIRLLAWLMIFAGVTEAVHAFAKQRGWGGFFFDLFTGILYVVGGFMILGNPAASAIVFTLIIAFILIFEGLFRVIAAATTRPPNWGWMLLHGGVTLMFGIMIWRQWPLSGLWVIGLFVGISMILNGWSLVMLSAAVKNMPAEADGDEPAAAN
ncbi:MAG: HdeD family acid-resistance protein [Verrucomicrobiales bacterium]